MLGNIIIMSYRALVNNIIREEKSYEESVRSFNDFNMDLNKDIDDSCEAKRPKILLLSPPEDNGMQCSIVVLIGFMLKEFKFELQDASKFIQSRFNDQLLT